MAKFESPLTVSFLPRVQLSPYVGGNLRSGTVQWSAHSSAVWSSEWGRGRGRVSGIEMLLITHGCSSLACPWDCHSRCCSHALATCLDCFCDH